MTAFFPLMRLDIPTSVFHQRPLLSKVAKFAPQTMRNFGTDQMPVPQKINVFVDCNIMAQIDPTLQQAWVLRKSKSHRPFLYLEKLPGLPSASHPGRSHFPEHNAG